MSVFTKVTADQLVSWLEDFSIGDFKGMEGIAAGTENTNYLVLTSKGKFVLTLFERNPVHELPFYFDLMKYLALKGFPTPRPEYDKYGQMVGRLNEKPAALLSFLEGRPIMKPTAKECFVVGQFLARLHVETGGFSQKKQNSRGFRWWGEMSKKVVPFIEADKRSVLMTELGYQSNIFTERLPRGVIHADLFRDNVLFGANGLTGVIDFYFACTDCFVYDVAIAVNDWCTTQNAELDTKRLEALLGGYQENRPFSDTEKYLWPNMLRASALRFWLSRLCDFYLPRKGEITFKKDPEYFYELLQKYRANSSNASLD